jgi:hypothetical protein
MRQEVFDSYLFMKCLRESLYYISKGYAKNTDSKKLFKNFFLKEATDLQILSLSTIGKLSEKKYDKLLESKYVSVINGMLGKLPNNEIILKPLSEFNLSSQESVASFVLENSLLHERPKRPGPGAGDWVKTLEKMNQTKSDLRKKMDSTSDPAVKTQISNKIKHYDDIIAKVKEKHSGDITKVKALAKTGAEKAKAGIKAAKAGIVAGTKKAADFAKSDVGKKVGLGLGAAAAAAAAIYGAYKLYKAYKNRKEGACKNLTGEAKKACMVKAYQDSIKAQIANLQSQEGQCSKSSDPEKCKAAIKEKISGLQARLSKKGK